MFDSQIIKTLTYPAYCIKTLDNGLVILSGGGGTSKTGVGNSIEIGRIDYDTSTQTSFSVIYNFTPNDAIMKFVCFLNENDIYLVAAVGCSIETYKMNKTVDKTDQKLAVGTSLTLVNQIKIPNQLEVTSLASYEFKSTKFVCAGTTNGSLLIIDIFNEKILKQIDKQHSKEIDDIQVDSNNNLLSISKDNRAFIWSLEDFSKKIELKAKNIDDKVFRIRHGRFSNNSKLFTTHIPIVRSNKNLKCFIIKWNSVNFTQEKSFCVPNTIITAFQININGSRLVFGDYEGRIVLIDDNFNTLARFTKKHASVVTDLAFCHDSLAPYDNNKLILSLSIDRTIQCYKYLSVNGSLAMNYYFILLIFIAFCLIFCYFFIYFE